MTFNLETTVCLACRNGLHLECWNLQPIDGETDRVLCCCSLAPVEDVKDNPFGTEKGRPLSNPGAVVDPTSTGRKRAAMLAPILDGMFCEWAGLKYAGGGVHPIVGCIDNQIIDKKSGDKENGFLQGDRHHSEDKNTLNNTPGVNLHRICPECHHRWHSLNDKEYPKKRPAPSVPFLPEVPYYRHDGLTKASDDDLYDSERWWALDPRARGQYPVDPPDEGLLITHHLNAKDTDIYPDPFRVSAGAEVVESGTDG